MDMDIAGPQIILVGIFFYVLLLPFFSLPNIIFSILLAIKLGKHSSYRRLRYLPLIFPFVGVGFYLTVDAFEKVNLGNLWMLLLGVISLLPLCFYLTFNKLAKK